MTIELRAPGARALVEPQSGGRLHQLFVEIDGREEPLLVTPDDAAAYQREPLAGGSFPMAPWPNRIRDGRFEWRGAALDVANGREHALHGLVVDRPWEVVARAGRVLEMVCDLGDRWPWEGRAWQRFEVGAGFLAMKMEVRAAREAFPAGCGWHPWFRRDVAGADDVRVTVSADQRYLLDRHLPTGELVAPEGEWLLDGSPLGQRRLDDCYSGLAEPRVLVEWPRLSLAIDIQCAAPHVQVYTPPEAFCIEPQTCPPDAFNLAARGRVQPGAVLAEPGRPLALSARWAWSVK